MVHPERRAFLKQAAARALGAAAGCLAGLGARTASPGREPRALRIVDTHQHLWDRSVLRLPWLEGRGRLNRDHRMADYLQAAAGLRIVKTVYMEVAVHDDDLDKEADYVIGLCEKKDNPMVAAVIGGRPAEEGFKKYITRFKDSPYVKGIRHILPAKRPELWAEKRLIEGVRLLGELGLRFDLCMPPGRLPEAIKLVDACPGTRFVLDHCGNADPKAFGSRSKPGKDRPAPSHDADAWRRDMAALARRDRVVCKVSGIVARADKKHWKPDDLAPIVDHCLEVFGPDRVMFASDWPVCTQVASLRAWVEALQEVVAGRSLEERQKLFHDNAVRFYGLG